MGTPLAKKEKAELSTIPYVPTEEERKWAFGAHIGSLGLGALAPLFTMYGKKDSEWVQMHSRESLNFQLTVHLVELVGLVLTFAGIGACIIVAAWGVGVLFAVYGATRAWSGGGFRYPVAIRFLKGGVPK